MWCTVFTEYWKQQETDLGVRWGVKGVSNIEVRKREFEPEKQITDPVTGEKVGFFPASKRFKRQLLQIPFALVAAVSLGAVIATCFGIEVFISEVYNGPLKSVLVSCYLVGCCGTLLINPRCSFLLASSPPSTLSLTLS
jgi:anoctamin-10